MARHRSPQSRRPSLPLLSPQFAAAGAGQAGGWYHTGGPHVRHARPSTGPFRTPSARIAGVVAAVGGVAVAAHLSAQGTPFPDADEVGTWFGAATPTVPAPRTPADATVGGSAIATLGGATAGTGVVGRAGDAVARARDTARSVRTPVPAAAPARPRDAATPSSGGGVRILSGRVTSGFGSRWGSQHQGLDIAAPIGTPIRVPMDGTVISAGPASGFGLWVRVRHADGTVTVYGHINRALVRVGQKVTAGQEIAEVGNRGQSTGPHLHIEVVTPAGTKVNPKPWLDRHGFRYGA